MNGTNRRSCSDLPSSLAQQNPPVINVIDPYVPDSGDNLGIDNPVCTVDKEICKISKPFSVFGSDMNPRDEWVTIPMNDVYVEDPQYLTTSTIASLQGATPWDRLSIASTTSMTISYAVSPYDAKGRNFINDKIRSVIAAIRQRAQIFKQRLARPSTPSSINSNDSPSPVRRRQRCSTVTIDSSYENYARYANDDCCEHSSRHTPKAFVKCLDLCRSFEFFNLLKAIEPQSNFYIVWLFAVSVCYVYNAWSIFYRAAFCLQATSDWWFTLDCIADGMYLLDLLVVNPRLIVLQDGFWIANVRITSRIYITSRNFMFNMAAMLPLNLFYFWLGSSSLLRLPRLLKIHTFREFFERFDHNTSSPYIIRIVRTLIYMLFLIHLNACAYYAYSYYEGIGRPDNLWVYNGAGNAYIRCILFATKIATSIGKNPSPQNEGEYLFMTVSWLSGVFIFAMLIGQIRDILHVASQRRGDYQRVMNRTMVYIKRLNLPKNLCDRTRIWFDFNWNQQHSLDEAYILKRLPLKMQMDIAMHVHYHVLSEVKLFKDFDRTLLRNIVLKLKPYLFLPGGYVCRKGEVGTEMYIVNDGQVNVMGGENDDVVMATLSKGSVFGEISLLSTGLGNRRTADVRSRGYSNLFILSKTDLHDAIRDYPMAEERLRRRSHKLFGNPNSDGRRASEDSVFLPPSSPARPSTPKLLQTVLQVVSPYSMTANLLRRGSHSCHCFNPNSVPSNGTLFSNSTFVSPASSGLPENFISPNSIADVSAYDASACPTPSSFNGPDPESSELESAPSVDEDIVERSDLHLPTLVQCHVIVHRSNSS